MTEEGGPKKIIEKPISEDDIEKILSLRQKLGRAKMREESSLYAELFAIINKITGGKFLDRRNVSHVWNAMYDVDEFFDKEQEFDPGRLEVNKKGLSQFHFSIAGNPYLKAQKGNILLIFSPQNRNLIRILRSYLNYLTKNPKEMSDIPKEDLDRMLAFIDKREQPVGGVTGYDWGKFLFKALGRQKKFRWSQIADCIVDLNAKKVYFFDK